MELATEIFLNEIIECLGLASKSPSVEEGKGGKARAWYGRNTVSHVLIILESCDGHIRVHYTSFSIFVYV